MALPNGLYGVEFQTPLGQSYGVVTLIDGHLRGGDSFIYYVGTYQQNKDQFSAKVRTDIHSNNPYMLSAFRNNRVEISISGRVQGTSATMTGKSPQMPNITLHMNFRKLDDY